jgi:hypothetical protein
LRARPQPLHQLPSVENTAHEEYRTTMTVPPHRAVKLMASASGWVVEGNWKHLLFLNKYVVTIRPTGEIVWILQRAD